MLTISDFQVSRVRRVVRRRLDCGGGEPHETCLVIHEALAMWGVIVDRDAIDNGRECERRSMGGLLLDLARA
jgi:hypothetical protein